jgi:hypothetical protein
MKSLQEYMDEMLTEHHAYQEDGNGTFESDGVHYDLNKILRMSSHQPVREIAVSEIDWVLPHCHPIPERVERADLRAPILVTTYRGRQLVVDGEHRLARAVRDGVKHLPYRRVSGEVMIACFVADRSCITPRRKDYTDA